MFPLKIRNRAKIPQSPSPFSILLKDLDRAIRQDMKIIAIQIIKEEMKLAIYSCHNGLHGK